MPKDTATINGVLLTRAQVEGALAEMNKPEVVEFKGGDRVKLNSLYASQHLRDEVFIVLDDYVGKRLPIGGFGGDFIDVINLNNGVWHRFPRLDLKLHRRMNDD